MTGGRLRPPEEIAWVTAPPPSAGDTVDDIINSAASTITTCHTPQSIQPLTCVHRGAEYMALCTTLTGWEALALGALQGLEGLWGAELHSAARRSRKT